jgi:hypothetical protein
LNKIEGNRHELKTWPDMFQGIWDGKKHHEVRKNDRGYKVGDFLELREWQPSEEPLRVTIEGYSGRRILAEVTWMTTGGSFGLPTDLCVLSIEVRDTHDGEQWVSEKEYHCIDCGIKHKRVPTHRFLF